MVEEDPTRAVEMITRLSGLFRHTVRGSRVERLPLGDEIEAARTFLEIQSLRFEDRLSWSVEAAAGLNEVQVPPLILQPLVENAVFHGASGDRPVRVEVRATAIEKRIVLRVCDDGPGPGRSTHQGSRTSLEDLRERVALLFGDEGSLETVAVPDGGFESRLCFPVGPFEGGEEDD